MQRHSTALARALIAQGVAVDVIAPHGHDAGDQGFPVTTLDWPPTRVYPLALHRWAQRVAGSLDWSRYDVVYGQGLTLWGRLPADAPPSVFNPHGLELCATGTRIGDAKAWPLRIGARRQAAQASLTISLGGHLTALATRCLGVDPARIRIVPNAVDLDRLTEAGAVERDPRLVLFVGRLFENKGLDVLVDAARLLPEDVRVVVVGDGPLRGRLEHGREPRIQLAGPVDETELNELYRRAAVLAVPSRADGMPTVILEAFAHRTPVVATDVGAVSELVSDATGVLLPRAEPAALAAALNRILELPEGSRRALGEAAATLVHERFTWPAVARRTIDVLEEARTMPSVR